MKSIFRAILIMLSVCVCLSSCDADPYQSRRPTDYVGSCWVCKGEGYEISLTVTETIESVLYVDGEETREVEFLWSAFSSGVIVYALSASGDSRETIIVGECEFGKREFVINVTDKQGCGEKLADSLLFTRIG